METLPSEILAVILAQTLDYASASVPALTLVNKRWNALLPVSRFKSGLQVYFELSAQQNHLSLMCLYYSWKSWKDYDLARMLTIAALSGSCSCMQQIKIWGATTFDWALFCSAKGGYTDCMWQLKEWGATAFDWALIGALEGNQFACIQLLKKWGATKLRC